MQNKVVRKGLVAGIIALFVGLALIPSFNAVSISKSEYTSPTPIIEVTWETYKFNGTWLVDINCSFNDNGSGIHSVAWYFNGLEQDYITGPGPFAFYFTVELSKAKEGIFKFEAYYGDGLSAFVEVDGSDIKSLDCFECQSNGKAHLAEKLLNRLEKNEVLSNVIDLDNPYYDRLICEILMNNYERICDIAEYYLEKRNEYQLGTFWYNIYFYIFTIYAMISAIPILLGAIFGCWGPYPY
jgi:hypothetical protein